MRSLSANDDSDPLMEIARILVDRHLVDPVERCPGFAMAASGDEGGALSHQDFDFALGLPRLA